MAKKWTNLNLPGALHFVTGNVLNRSPIFTQDSMAVAFLEVCQNLRAEGLVKLVAFVLMPDHFHLVANPQDGNIQWFISKLKSFSAKRIVELAPKDRFLRDGTNQVWQQSFRSLPLWSGWMIWQKINYIHANPIRAGLASTGAEYPWSSFRSIYSKDTDPLLAVDRDWWWPGDVEKITAYLREVDERLEQEFLEERQRKLDSATKASEYLSEFIQQ